MKIDLAAMWRRARNPRRTAVTLRPISAPATLATDLYLAAYKPLVSAWEQAVPDIIALYSRSLAQLQTDGPADVAARIDRVVASNSAVVTGLKVRLERWARILEQWHRRKWRGAVLSATGVDLQTMMGPTDAQLTLEATIEQNVALVSSVSEQARERISGAVYRGLNARSPAADVAREIREATGMARRRALNIAADQTVKLTAALNDERRRQVGITAWAWVHSAKLHPRKWHLERDGMVYSDDPDQVGEKAGRHTILAAPPADDRPGIPPFCGCTSRAVLVL